MTGQLKLDDLELDVRDEEWGALAAEAGNIFGTPEWISTWWRHYGSGRQLLTKTCRGADGSLVAVLPLYLWSRRPFRVVRFLGHGPGDALGPICRSCDRLAVASAVSGLLDDFGAGLLIGEYLPSEEGWSTLLGASVYARSASPVLALHGVTWESFLASRSANFRYSIRRRERTLGGEHRVRFRLAVDPERFGSDIDCLFALHRARWPEDSSFSAAEPFHREFAAAAFARGWCRLWLLEIDGEARAAWYGFRFANVEFAYQAGRDPRWDRYSLGFLLLAHSIREAAADGVREYRLLRGGEDIKYRFASHDPGRETIVLWRNPVGRAVYEAALKLPTPIRRRLRRA